MEMDWADFVVGWMDFIKVGWTVFSEVGWAAE